MRAFFQSIVKETNKLNKKKLLKELKRLNSQYKAESHWFAPSSHQQNNYSTNFNRQNNNTHEHTNKQKNQRNTNTSSSSKSNGNRNNRNN